MISIIISSYKQIYFDQVVKNIASSIGVPYEIIKIDNPGIYSITKAYNKGAKAAKFNVLCFLHEDIKIHSDDWGKALLKHFDEVDKLGLIGIAGSTTKLRLPGPWGHPDSEKNKLHLIHRDKRGNSYKLSTFKDSELEFLKVVDGVFLATPKAVWQEILFDEDIDGFHLYDIDFSLRVAERYKVAITYNVLIEHYSHGNFGDEWIFATLKYHNNQNKAHLFDPALKKWRLRRSSYYVLLAKNKITFKTKLIYAKHLGVDVFSIPAFLLFLFPRFGNTILKAAFNIRNKIVNNNVF